MISKDGKRIAVFDTSVGVTKIFELQTNGSCKEVLNLGIPTGKVEFNYQGTAITFHVDTYDKSYEGTTFGAPKITSTKNIYTMELKPSNGKLLPGKIKRITSNVKPGENSYYPSFTLDGKVVYIHGEHDSKKNSGHYSIRKVNPNLSSEAATNYLSPNISCGQITAASYALGELMQTICRNLVNQRTFTSSEAVLWSLGLDPDGCKKLVNRHWDKLEQDIKKNEKLLRTNRFSSGELSKVTKEALLAVCPKKAPAQKAHKRPHPIVHEATGGKGPVKILSGDNFFKHRCFSCHDGGSATHYEWNKLSLQEINKMLIVLQEGTMPKGFLRSREQQIQPLVQKLLERQEKLEERIMNGME